MRKRIFIVFLALIWSVCSVSLCSGQIYPEWVSATRGDSINGRGAIVDIEVDPSGNKYVCGWRDRFADFDPGPGSFFLDSAGSNAAFFARYDAAGNLDFAKHLNIISDFGAVAEQIAFDPAGNIVVAGTYSWPAYTDQWPIDMDPGPGIRTLTPTGMGDIFLARYDTSGNLLFRISIGGDLSQDLLYDVATDSAGNIILAGRFTGVTGDLDPGPGVVTLTSVVGATTANDAFLVKYSPTGALLFAHRIGRTSGSGLQSAMIGEMHITSTGDIYATGRFTGTIDFDGGPGSYLLTGSSDLFFAHFDPTGVPVWVKQVNSSGSGSVAGVSVSLSAGGEINLCGRMFGTADFDPGAGTYNVMVTGTSGGQGIFIARYTSLGDLVFAKGMSPYSSYDDINVEDIEAEPSGNICIIGDFGGLAAMADIDPSPGFFYITPPSPLDRTSFCARYDATGNLISGIALAFSTGEAAILSSGDIVMGGFQSNIFPLDLDPGAGTVIDPMTRSMDLLMETITPSLAYVSHQRMPGQRGGNEVSCLAMGADLSGNIYTAGLVLGRTDFDPGADTAFCTGDGLRYAYAASYDTLGNFLQLNVWPKEIVFYNYNVNENFVVPPGGGYYMAAWQLTNSDWDPGPGTYIVADTGYCLARYGTAGNLLWAGIFGGSGSITVQDMVTDDAGNLYVTGSMSGIVDFNLGPGTTNLSSLSSSPYIAKYSPTGTLIFAIRMNSSASRGSGICTDDLGNIFITGNIASSCDFDPGAGTASLVPSGPDLFIAAYSPSGAYLWAELLSTAVTIADMNIESTPSGNILLTGHLKDTIDLDPGPATVALTSPAGRNDIIIAQYNSSGAYQWGSQLTGLRDETLEGVSIDSAGNIWLAGMAGKNTDFDPGPGYYSPPLFDTLAGRDAFFGMYDSTGALINLYTIGGLDLESINAIDLDPAGNILTAGYYNHFCDFDPGASVSNYASMGYGEAFVARYKPCPASLAEPENTTSSLTLCEGDTALLSAAGALGGILSWYDAPGGGTLLGYGSSLTVTPPAGTTTYYVEDALCLMTSGRTAIAVTVNPDPVVNLGADKDMCIGGLLTLDAGGGFSSYSWSTGATTSTVYITGVLGGSGSYAVSVADAAGCTGADTVMVMVHPDVLADLGPDTSMCPGTTILLGTGGSFSSYAWSTGATTPTITTSAAGFYSVTATDGFGCTTSDDMLLTAEIPVSAGFSYAGGGLTFDFTDLSTGSPFAWAWDFGDGSTSAIANPSHTYSIGVDTTFTVCLTVTNICGPDTHCEPLVITAQEDAAFAKQVQVYPVPADDVLFISIWQGDPKAAGMNDITCTLYSADGRDMLASQTQNGRNIEFRLDVSQLTSGIYMVCLAKENGERVWKKVEVMR